MSKTKTELTSFCLIGFCTTEDLVPVKHLYTTSVNLKTLYLWENLTVEKSHSQKVQSLTDDKLPAEKIKLRQ